MMQPVVIRFKEEDKRLLELEANNEKSTVAEITRKAVREYLKTKQKKPNGGEVLLKWALRKDKGIKKSRVNSMNYKYYLYGPGSKKFEHLWKDKK